VYPAQTAQPAQPDSPAGPGHDELPGCKKPTDLWALGSHGSDVVGFAYGPAAKEIDARLLEQVLLSFWIPGSGCWMTWAGRNRRESWGLQSTVHSQYAGGRAHRSTFCQRISP
jgi:hypothetical protein